MPQIGRLIGGAGTGKTTELLRMMTAAKERLGGDIMNLGMASFTRAAREEAVDRASLAWGVEAKELAQNGWFRTVHSVAFRVLGLSIDQIVRLESKTDLQWISEIMGVPLQVNVDEDTGRVMFSGDKHVAMALNCWELARTTLRPLEEVVRSAAQFDDDVLPAPDIVRICTKYESAKRLEDRLDYSDMLLRFAGIRAVPDIGFEECDPMGDAPEVKVWLFDEQQDASPLLDAVCKRLVAAPTVQWAYVVGDPFQSIFGFAGSSADCFMGWTADKERIMPKSYRCPRAILELGESCLRRMTKGYFDRGIAPADHDGGWESSSDIGEAVRLVRPGEKWLMIARTNFQANRIAAELAREDVPFRSTKASAGPTVRSQGLRALWELQHGKPVSGESWGRALEVLPSRTKGNTQLLVRGAKSSWSKPETQEKYDAVFPRDLEELGATETLRTMIADGRWPELCDYGSQFVRQVKRWGIDETFNPSVRVGTIHSVKGAEADNVALLTTTGAKVQAGLSDERQYNEECRIAYVGVTRARRRLVVVDEGTPKSGRMEVL